MPYQDEQLASSRWTLIRWFGFDKFEPERAVTSYWVSSKVFLWIRFPLMLYSTVVMWAAIGSSAQEGRFRTFFAYFTNLTYVGLHAYLVTSFYHHVRYLMNKDRRPSSFLDQPTTLNYLYYYLYHTVICFNIVTPVVFWSVLATPTEIGSGQGVGYWVTCSVHAASFFMMLVDVIFNRMKIQINIILLIVIHVVLYMCLTFIVFRTTGWWVYPFLDWSQGVAGAIWYVLVGVVIEMSFFIQMAIHDLRDWIARLTGRDKPSEPDTLPETHSMRQTYSDNV